MALDISISALRVALHQANARWTADVTNLTYLQDDQKLLRLGALPPDGIAGLRQREVAAAASKIFLEMPVGLPRSWDYRDVDGENFVTPVRDQGSCGSCVAFAVIAAVEAMVLIKMGNFVTVDLSEAQLFYCYAASQGRNCQNGWWPQYALPFLRDDGVGDEASFPYSPGNQPCNVASDWRTRSVRITGSHEIQDLNAMKVWLATRGPLIASFALYDDFFSYRSGVYHHVTGGLKGGHSICVIGYDDSAQCWICKNSWGPGWGEDGFFRIGYRQCGIDASMWAVEGVTSHKITLVETSRVTPGLAVIGNRLALAWTGTDNPGHLNIMTMEDEFQFSGKSILYETSFDGPAIAAGPDRLFIAWTGTDADHHLNVMSTTDCRTFGAKVSLDETSPFGPAVAWMNGYLYLAWVGTDHNRSLNVMSSNDGVTWGNKVVLDDESSDSQIGLCSANGRLYLIWQGTDSNSSINVLESTDGKTWANKTVLPESTDHTPAAVMGSDLVLAWTGRDSNHSLNRMRSTSGPSGFGQKLVFHELATAGVALANFKGKNFIAWGGTDSAHHINVMEIPTP